MKIQILNSNTERIVHLDEHHAEANPFHSVEYF